MPALLFLAMPLKIFRVLDNTVAAREASLEQQFSAFVNMDAFYQSVTMLTVEKAGALGLSIGDYTADAANRQSLLGSLTPVVLRALRRGGATSCFVILDGEVGSTQKDGLYLRDFNPSDSPESNSDVLIEAGPSQLLYDYIDAKKGLSAGNGIFRLPLMTLVLATATVTCWSRGCSTM